MFPCQAALHPALAKLGSGGGLPDRLSEEGKMF